VICTKITTYLLVISQKLCFVDDFNYANIYGENTVKNMPSVEVEAP
jgi:hypothetical protein